MVKGGVWVEVGGGESDQRRWTGYHLTPEMWWKISEISLPLMV